MVHTRYDLRLRSYCSDTGGKPSLHEHRYQPHIVYKLGFPNLLRPSPLDMLCTQRRPCPNRSQAHSGRTHGYQLLHSFQHDNDRIGCFPRWQRSGQRRSVHSWNYRGQPWCRASMENNVPRVLRKSLLSMAGSGPKPLPLSQPLQSRRNIFQTHSSPSPQHPHRRRCLHYKGRSHLLSSMVELSWKHSTGAGPRGHHGKYHVQSM